MKTLKGVLCVAVIAASCLVALPARAQIEVEVFPPAEFIATAAPVYHEGRAAYWYRNRWYYREGRNWRYYHEEPAFLRDHRTRHEPVRQYYGRAHEGGYRRHR
jgi:hypothetical protein